MDVKDIDLEYSTLTRLLEKRGLTFNNAQRQLLKAYVLEHVTRSIQNRKLLDDVPFSDLCTGYRLFLFDYYISAVLTVKEIADEPVIGGNGVF